MHRPSFLVEHWQAIDVVFNFLFKKLQSSALHLIALAGYLSSGRREAVKMHLADRIF